MGVVGSGIGLVSLLGCLESSTVRLYGTLGNAGLMLLVGFGPLHRISRSLVVELDSERPDPEHLDDVFGREMRWGLLQSGFMLIIMGMMVGLRGLL